MKKFLKWSLGLFTFMLSFLLVGCVEQEEMSIPDFKFKSLEEYATDINNLTVNMEVIFQGTHSKYLFTNNSEIFVNSSTDPDGQEYGYVFDARDKSLYSIDRCKLSFVSKENEIIKNVANILSKSYLLFFTSLNDPIITYKGRITVCGRLCHQYQAIVNKDGKEFIYHLSIDDKTELCLRCNCICERKTFLYFVTKSFSYEPQIEKYEQDILDYKSNLEQQEK